MIVTVDLNIPRSLSPLIPLSRIPFFGPRAYRVIMGVREEVKSYSFKCFYSSPLSVIVERRQRTSEIRPLMPPGVQQELLGGGRLRCGDWRMRMVVRRQGETFAAPKFWLVADGNKIRERQKVKLSFR